MPSILDDAVELRHLRYFRALAEAGSFTRAAAAIGLRQPTLSHQIRQLEVALGAELFQRGRNACRLTAAGELLLPYVRRVLGDMEALRQVLDDQSALRRGSLTLAALPILGERLLPRALAAFHLAHPGIQVRVSEMSVDEMERALAAGLVELCLGTVSSMGNPTRTHLLFEEELVAVVPAASAAAVRGTLTVAELAAEPVIVPPPGFGTRTTILHAWAKVRRMPAFALEVNSTTAILEAVVAGGVVGVVPACGLWGRNPEGWQPVRIVQPTLRRAIGVTHALVGRRRPAAEALLPYLRQAAAACSAESSLPSGMFALALPQ